jgi:Ni,Fe-hydrogenase I large subunit
MAKRITIDPITRIEGHLRIDVEVDNNAVSNAWASCTMWRGIEKILRGRDPRDAWLFTQRFCGVCTTVHAMASVRAVEDAFKLEVPLNAQYIRNLILIAHALHDHIVHFYQLSALDWVDVLQIPKADPAATAKLAESLSPWTRNSRNEFKAAQDRVNAVASQRATRHLHERLLGPSRDAALAGCESAGLLALRAGVGISAQSSASGRNSGFEDSAHSEPHRRRRGERDRSWTAPAGSAWKNWK